MRIFNLFMTAAVVLAAVTLTGCKDDEEPGLESSDVQGLFINEICSGGTDWIEFYNAGEAEISLAGYHVQDNKGTDEEYTFPSDARIAAKGFLVIEEGTFAFGISGNGDAITLLDENYAKIDDVVVPAMEDGFTYARVMDGGTSWEVMQGGTKGRSNTGEADVVVPDTPGESDSPVLINEVQGATIDGVQTDFIELYNPSDADVDISGYRLQDDKGAAEEFVVADGTVLAAGAFAVFYKDETFTFGLGGSGDVVTVLDAAGDMVDSIEYPAMDDGSSYARIPDGSSSWTVCTTPTPGESNGGNGGQAAGYDAIRLNELNGNDKFVELYNASDADMDISGMYFVKDDESEDSRFTAEAGTVIPAHGFLTVWSEKSDMAENAANPDFHIFAFGLSADKSVKIELFAPDGTSVDVFENLSKALGETWGEDDGMFDSKDKGSFARDVDGTGDWYVMTATEGESNATAQKVDDQKIEW